MCSMKMVCVCLSWILLVSISRRWCMSVPQTDCVRVCLVSIACQYLKMVYESASGRLCASVSREYGLSVAQEDGVWITVWVCLMKMMWECACEYILLVSQEYSVWGRGYVNVSHKLHFNVVMVPQQLKFYVGAGKLWKLSFLYVQVLESFKIMDYSLLVGVYNLDQAARQKVWISPSSFCCFRQQTDSEPYTTTTTWCSHWVTIFSYASSH